MGTSPGRTQRCNIRITCFYCFACRFQFIPVGRNGIHTRFFQDIHVCSQKSRITNNYRQCILSTLDISQIVVQVICFFIICKVFIDVCQGTHIDIVIEHFHVQISYIRSVVGIYTGQIFFFIIIPRNNLYVYFTIILFLKRIHLFVPEFFVCHFSVRRCKGREPKSQFIFSA